MTKKITYLVVNRFISPSKYLTFTFTPENQELLKAIYILDKKHINNY